MHLGAAELLLVGILVDRHLHQRRPTEVNASSVLLEDDVVAHAGHVGTASSARSEDERDGGDACGRELREVLEARSAGHEDLRLLGKVGAA